MEQFRYNLLPYYLVNPAIKAGLFAAPPTVTSSYKGWRRPIGCLKLQVIFCKRATNYRALLWKMTCKDKASYGSSPPCNVLAPRPPQSHLVIPSSPPPPQSHLVVPPSEDKTYLIRHNHSRRKSNLKYSDLSIGLLSCPLFWVTGTSVYFREFFVEILGTPVKIC